jgi:hypothetical protein
MESGGWNFGRFLLPLQPIKTKGSKVVHNKLIDS